MPMIMITGQKGIMSSRQARFQIVDVVTAFKPLTKLSRQIVSASTIPTLVRDAFRIAMEERPGPVLLELPEDVAGEECEHAADGAAASDRNSDGAPRGAGPCRRDDPEGEAAVDHARGRGVRPRSTAGIGGFVRRTKIPFFTTQMGKGTVPAAAISIWAPRR
jgi:acetolactate synthase-1/2/3 large subunit